MGHFLSKIAVCAALFTVLAVLPAKGVFAEGLQVSADKDSCENGDKITVTVDASAIEGETPPDISVEFDANRLNFENCSVEYGGGGGGLVTFKDKQATIEFTTLSGGDATVNVTATAEDAESPESASVTVSVNGEDTAAAMSGAAASTTGVSEGTIDAGDGRVVQKVFADEFMPVLFHKDTTDFKGETVECASFDMGDMKVVYTTDESGADGKFMMLNSASGELEDFRMIQGIENRFIIVLSDCEGPIPDGYTKAVLEWNGQTLTAFMEESVAAGAAENIDGINPSDFFLVYAMSSEGNKGWYRYDKNEGTYQRFINTSASVSEGENAEGDDEGESYTGFLDEYIPKKVQSILLMVCAPLALILIITVIILAVKLHDYAEDLDAFYEDYYGDEEYEYADEEEEDEEPSRRAKPGAVTAASLVGRSMSEDDEDDEEEDEEDEEDEEADEAGDEEDKEADDAGDEEEDEDEEDDVKPYRPLTRKERKELEREEKWRLKEEKKAAKRRAQGYEEATPMDWSSFEKGSGDGDERMYKKSAPPKYMTESMADVPEEDEEEQKPKKAPLPPRRKTVTLEEDPDAAPVVLKEEEQREKQRRLFEQQQRIEEQRRIEAEQQEAARQKEQQQFIASRTEDMDLDEDFQFEFLEL